MRAQHCARANDLGPRPVPALILAVNRKGFLYLQGLVFEEVPPPLGVRDGEVPLLHLLDFALGPGKH